MQKMLWFTVGMLIGLTILSITKAAVPNTMDNTAIRSRLSEIRIPKEGKINFDADITRLSQREGQYQEKLPALSNHPRLKNPIQRVSQQKYQPSSNNQTSIAKKR